jgi:RHS repeat-associated protein
LTVTRSASNGTTLTYTYDADNRVLSLEHSNALGRVAGFGYAYDNEGNKLDEQRRDAPTNSQAYLYDADDRLTNFSAGTLSGTTISSPSVLELWTLDPLGNWNSVVSNSVPQSRAFDAANELTSINATNHLSYDLVGNLVQDALYRYSYDEENRLIGVVRQADSAAVGQYLYDALGRRVIKVADPAGVANTNLYFYGNARIIEEQDSAGTTLATYTYGNYVDEVLTMNRGGQSHYYHQNALWSPCAMTDFGGNVVERYAYDAYGLVSVLDAGYHALPANPWGAPHSAVTNEWLFTGRQLDEEDGTYFYRARYYDPLKGRYLQRDAPGHTDDLNLYEYADSRPTRELDPSGREAIEVENPDGKGSCQYEQSLVSRKDGSLKFTWTGKGYDCCSTTLEDVKWRGKIKIWYDGDDLKGEPKCVRASGNKSPPNCGEIHYAQEKGREGEMEFMPRKGKKIVRLEAQMDLDVRCHCHDRKGAPWGYSFDWKSLNFAYDGNRTSATSSAEAKLTSSSLEKPDPDLAQAPESGPELGGGGVALHSENVMSKP